MKKLISLFALVLMLSSFTITTTESATTIESDETPCQNYAVGQILNEIDAFGPMSNSEVAEAYNFYMDICESNGGGGISAVILNP